MRKSVRIILIVIATGVFATFLTLWYQTAQTEPALAWARPLPPNTQVEKGDVKVVQVSQKRDFPVMADAAQVVGNYTTRRVTGEGLVVPSDVTPQLPPDRFVFDNGSVLPEGTNAYGFTLDRPLAALLQPGNKVDVYLVVPGEELMYLLLQKQPVLYTLMDDPVAALALDPAQVSVVEGMMSKVLEQRRQQLEQERNDEDIEVPEPYYLLLPTQGENADREPLSVYPFIPDNPAIMGAPTPVPVSQE